MAKKRNSKYKTIRGVVSPAEWDDDDRVTGVVITTDEDLEYFVDPHGKGEYLLDLIDEHVEASGIVHNDDGDYTIIVKKVKHSKEHDQDDDLDDDDLDDDDLDDDE